MTISDKNKILAIVGPTGVGKTTYAIHLASQIKAELISADSRQIYIGMDIATGKEVNLGSWQNINQRPALIIQNIPLHGLNLTQPDQPFSVAEWVTIVKQLLSEIKGRGNIPIVVGGSGFYLSALMGKVDTLASPPNQALRRQLANLTTQQLRDKLAGLDVVKLNALNPSDRQNPARLIRAVELAANPSSKQPNITNSETTNLNLLGLSLPQRQLYAKVDHRIDAMIEQGLVEETKNLLTTFPTDSLAMTGIGYKEIADYLTGQTNLEQAIQRIKYRTHHYIRRQNTWWRKQTVNWVDTGQLNWQPKADQLANHLLNSYSERQKFSSL